MLELVALVPKLVVVHPTRVLQLVRAYLLWVKLFDVTRVACTRMLHERPARVHDTRARYLGNNPSARDECSNECNEFEHELCARQRVCERVLERVQRVRARVSKRVMLLPSVSTNE